MKIMFLKIHKNCQNIFLTSSRFLCFLLLWGFFEQPIKVCMCSNCPITACACMPVMTQVKNTWGFGCVSHRHARVKSICRSASLFCRFKADLLLCWSTITWNTATVSDNEVSNPREQAALNTAYHSFYYFWLFMILQRGPCSFNVRLNEGTLCEINDSSCRWFVSPLLHTLTSKTQTCNKLVGTLHSCRSG